ncbi:iron-containing alcohol dehydrogenase [Cohnella zeiphila]|uniref:Iron-containing alcohol dehydrogenase n=1 Tax=Cohnella zeiphila TaxID=2761120 RepID=A0A7X0SIL1_9BACL|nr:iron-containing alcohol dehydrogenase [Cohnella zeiphila]MBB6730666.1 iron-containing alcohol dehydrogenase [Cohnella zeiphila]
MSNLPYSFQTAARIVAGNGSLDRLADLVQGCGEVKRALVIAQNSAVRLGFAERIEAQLRQAGIASERLTGMMNEPTADHIGELHARIKETPFDVYIAIGGGSVLDAAKILSVLRTNKERVEEMVGTDRVRKPGVPTVLIPTTSGTGSEVTPNAIVTFPEEELKIGAVSRHLLPAVALLDPELTLELPGPVTAATGMDAFTHALESFISNKANPISDMFALEAMRKISGSIETAYREGRSLKAREDMLIGSMYGGMALTGSGTAAVHALAYPLGGKFHIPHGVANSMLLPHVMAFNYDAIEERLAEAATVMGLREGRGASRTAAAEAVIEKIAEWTKTLDIPQQLAAFGVREEHVPELAVAASKVTRLLDNNPKPLDIPQIEALYRKLLA